MPFNKAVRKNKEVNNQCADRSAVCWPVSVFISRHIGRAILALIGIISSLCLAIVHANAQSNSASPLGTNLSAVNYYTAEQPFLNILKTGNSWSAGSGSESTFYASLDANGYPPSLVGYTSAYTTVMRNLSGGLSSYYYPSGTYVWLYDGTGTFSFSGDASVTSSAPGRILLNVATPSSVGITITLTSTGSGSDYAKNFRLVFSPDSTSSVIGTREALLNSGEIFNPDFIARIRPYKTLRFMDWMATNQSYQANWLDRPTPNWVFWNDAIKFNNGDFNNQGIVPVEVMVALCNEIGADCWFNMPLLSTDDYVTQFATLVHSTLNANSKVYIEYGNELWNQAFPAALENAVAALGWAAFPGTNGDTWNGVFAYGMLRAVQNGATWKSVWGADAGRVVRVVAGQSGYEARNQFILGFTAGMAGGNPSKFSGTVAANVDAFATAPYFGYAVPDTFTLDQLFTEMMYGGLVSGGYPGGMIKQALDWMAQNYADAKSYGLPLVAYEGGQSFVDYSGSDTALQNLYLAANRDPRMGTAYAAYFNGWKNAGGTLFNHYYNVGTYSKWGYWGALENVLQTSSPKYDALINFISANPCWWNGCSSTSPTSPTNSPTTPTADTTPPSVPTALTAAAVSGTQVNLSWTASTDNVGVAGYNVFRNGTKLGATSSISYQDNGLSAGTVYTYSVSAYDAVGNTSAQSSGVSVTTPIQVNVSVSSPTNGAVIKGNGSVNIAVSAVGGNIAQLAVQADGNTLATCLNAVSCSATWQGKKMSAGTHIVGGSATNSMGFSGSATVTITALK